MELIRQQFGLTALRLGYTQGGARDRGHPQVTCSLRAADAEPEEWWEPADDFQLLAPESRADSDDGIEGALAGCVRHLQSSPMVHRLQPNGDALWLAVTAEHPLLPGLAWERGLAPLALPVLRLPGQLNTAPPSPPPRPRVVLCVSMPMAKTAFPADELVERALDALGRLGNAEVHIFSDAEWAPLLQNRFGHRAQVHDPHREGPFDQARRTTRPAGYPSDEDPVDHVQPWLAWIEDQMDCRVDVLHLIGHGYLANGQGAFAVAEAPDHNHDSATARFVWPQQIAGHMTRTGAWGLVATAAAPNYSVPGMRLLTNQVAALRSAATAFLDIERAGDPTVFDAVYRLLLQHPQPPPADTSGLTLIMHPRRFGLEAPVTTSYQPARTDLADWVDSGAELPSWMVGAQHQVRQWETELSFDSDAGQVDSTRNALEVAKSRLDDVMRSARQTGGTA